jgi:hypothetical protein
MAAGEGTRWGNHRGVPKHLVDVDGEPLLARLVRQFEARGCEVVTLTPNDDRYLECGGWARAPRFYELDTDKFLSTVEWWLPDDLTVVVYGDCYLSDEAADALMWPGWVGRAGPSDLTGKQWGELFGVSVAPRQHGELAAAILRVRGLLLERKIWRGGGWEVYRATQGLGLHPDDHEILHDFREIDDWSEDFDYPKDYERWLARRSG